MKTLYLIRGISGSGKSTLAEIIAASTKSDSITLAADDYFTDPQTGEYNFDATKLPQAHAQCQIMARHAMSAGTANIIVHNTFTRHWEMQPYITLAKEFGYSVFRIICANNFGNVHNVPDEIVNKQAERFEF